MNSGSGGGKAGRLRWPDPFTLTVLVVCTVIELALQASDLGLVDLPRLRIAAYTYGGFWPGLLDTWRPNYPGQAAAMFLTYSVLHGGFVHYLVNMVTLLSLGAAVWERTGTARYAAIYVASILGGALGFALLAPDYRPMVGASGALFGLAGGLMTWEALDRRALRLTMVPVLRGLAIFVVLNIVLWWAMAGQLAWQTHLGGFLAGAAMAAILGQRPPDDTIA